MSSFFTRPASQKKRKRTQPDVGSKPRSSKAAPRNKIRDESISGSDLSDDNDDDEPRPNGKSQDFDGSGSESDEDPDEDAGAKRVRLAEQYLANTQKQVLEEVGFDAADVDAENLRRRMGDRLKEDTAETRGKLYRWISQDFDWNKGERAQFRHHQKPVTGTAMSGDYVYTVGKDAVLVKWRLPAAPESQEGPARAPRSRKPIKVQVSKPFGQKPASDDHHTSAILCIAASQDGKFVATGGADKKLIVWDAHTLKPLRTFFQHRDAVISLAFRRGTNQLFSASKDRTVKIWSLDELTYVETLFGHQDEVVDVGALAQETCVTVGARDRTARFWKVVEESQLVFRGGGAPSRSKVKTHSNDDSALGPETAAYHEGSMDRIACIDDETFITGSDNGSLSLWNIHKKKAVFVYPLAHGLDPPLPLDEVSAEIDPDEAVLGKPQPRWITALRAIPFSDVFISGSWDGYIRVWKLSSDKRRIEALGRIGCPAQSIVALLDQEGLRPESLSSSALQALQEGDERHGLVNGVVNDIAIMDKGDRAKDGIFIVAAVGKEHRLGRWKRSQEAKNYGVLFEVPRKTADDGANSMTSPDLVSEGRDDFAGFD